MKQDSINSGGESQPTYLYDYYQQFKSKMVYKRYPEYDPDYPAKLGGNTYFATYISKLDMIGNKNGVPVDIIYNKGERPEKPQIDHLVFDSR